MTLTCTRDDGGPIRLGRGNDFMKTDSTLDGINVLLTRPREQSTELKALFEAKNATVFVQPTIEILPPENWEPVDRAIESLGCYDFLVFASANGVRAFFERAKSLLKNGLPLSMGKPPLWVATGPGTQQCLVEYGVTNTAIPSEGYDAEGVISLFSHWEAAGKRVLLVRGDRGRTLLSDELARLGAETEQITVYRSIDLVEGLQEIAYLLHYGKIHWVTVTSSAIGRSLVRMFGESLRRSKIASIGPVTTQALTEIGFPPTVEAAQATMPALVEAVVGTVARNRC